MTHNLSTARYGIVTLSTARDSARHYCWRTLAGARVSRFYGSHDEALRDAARVAR